MQRTSINDLVKKAKSEIEELSVDELKDEISEKQSRFEAKKPETRRNVFCNLAKLQNQKSTISTHPKNQNERSVKKHITEK